MTVNVGRNVWYVTTSTIVSSVFTTIFWLISARLVGPQAVGTASYMNSLLVIISTILLLDVSLGMKRSLGMAITCKDKGKYKQILTSSIFVAAIGISATILILTIPQFHMLEILKIQNDYRLLFIAMIVFVPLQLFFSEALIAAFNSRGLIMPLILSIIVRFSTLFVGTYVFHAPIISTVLAFFSSFIILSALYIVNCFKIFFGDTHKTFEDIYSNASNVLHAGLSSWVPHVINVLGNQLGIVTIAAIYGESAGGKFYLAMSIPLVMLFIVVGITKVTHSYISRIDTERGQAEFLSYTMKIAFMFTMPLSIPLLFFSGKFLSLMGHEFASVGTALSILISGLPMAIICEMIYYFVYGKGDHRSVLFVGLVGNVPRIFLYILLTPLLGTNGVAIAYVIGTICQLILSMKVSKEHSIVLNFKQYAFLSIIPLALGLVALYLGIHYIFSSLVIIFGSIFVYIITGTFTDSDLRNLMSAGLPKNTARKLYPKVSRFVKK